MPVNSRLGQLGPLNRPGSNNNNALTIAQTVLSNVSSMFTFLIPGLSSLLHSRATLSYEDIVSTLSQNWLYLTVLAWLSSKLYQIYYTLDPLNKLIHYAYIDSTHQLSDESYRYLLHFWESHPSFNRTRDFLTTTGHTDIDEDDYHNGRTYYSDDDDYGDIYSHRIPPPPPPILGSRRVDKGEDDDREDDRLRPRFWPKTYESLYFVRYGVLFRFTKNGGPDGGPSNRGAGGNSVDRGVTLTVRCFSLNRTPLIKLLLEARQMYRSKQAKRTMLSVMVWDANTRLWNSGAPRYGRSFESVIMDEGMKQKLLADAREFLRSETEKWYVDRGIPYKRGYIFFGAPGVGKTSTIQALGSELDLPVYILPVASKNMTDWDLSNALRNIPSRSILVCEDIDVWSNTRKKRNLQDDGLAGAGAGSSDDGDRSTSDESDVGYRRPLPRYGYPGYPPPPPPAHMGLSLSALLNLIDGVEAAEGRILIMTTNDLKGLDPALIRPGRVDLFFEYKRATRDQAARLFREFYKDWRPEQAKEDDATPEASSQENGEVKRTSPRRVRDIEDDDDVRAREEAVAATNRAEVERLSHIWASFIEDEELTMAALQGMLLEHKKQPSAAIDAMPVWIEETREARAKAADPSESKKKEKEKKTVNPARQKYLPGKIPARRRGGGKASVPKERRVSF